MGPRQLSLIQKGGTGLWSLASTTIVLMAVAVYSPDDWLRAKLWILYAFQYLMVIRVLLKQEDRWLFFLSPSFVTVSYIALNSCLGAYAFQHGLVAVQENYLSYLGWTNLGWVTAFILSANFTLIVSFFWARAHFKAANREERSFKRERATGEKILVIGFCVGAMLVFSLIELDFGLFGGSRNFSIIPQTLAFLSAVILLVKTRQRGRFLLYILALVYFSSFSSFDKRNAIFLIAPVIFIECITLQRLRINVRFLIRVSVTSISILLLITMMSIYRGYGNYNPETFIDTRHFVFDYITDPMFPVYVGNNMEFNYTFFHSHQAIEYVITETNLMLYGSTFLKVLYVALPRYLFPSKPDSIVTYYTEHHALSHIRWDPEVYSWPCTIYCEFFWNFHIAGLLLLLLVYYAFSYCYFRIVGEFRYDLKYEYILYLFAYQQLLQLIRGSGFDDFVVSILVALGFSLVLFFPILGLIKSSKCTAVQT